MTATVNSPLLLECTISVSLSYAAVTSACPIKVGTNVTEQLADEVEEVVTVGRLHERVDNVSLNENFTGPNGGMVDAESVTVALHVVDASIATELGEQDTAVVVAVGSSQLGRTPSALHMNSNATPETVYVLLPEEVKVRLPEREPTNGFGLLLVVEHPVPTYGVTLIVPDRVPLEVGTVRRKLSQLLDLEVGGLEGAML